MHCANIENIINVFIQMNVLINRVFPDMSARSACLLPNVSADMSADMSARLVGLSTDADIFHKLYS